MTKFCWIVALCVGATGAALVAQETTKTTAKPDGPTEPRKADSDALKALLARFCQAYNAGDAKAAAESFTEDALVVTERGGRIEGRAAIAEALGAAFQENPGDTIAVSVDALRFVGTDAALEEGRTTITPAKGGTPEVTRYTAIYVREKGKWLQSAVRDETAELVTPHDRLKELEWMTGEWVNESRDAVVHTTCKWSEDGNFLLREFTMKTMGQPVLSGTQRIGWDPVREQFRTWVFDSEGGFADGYWSRDGDRWVIKMEATRQDGKHASATNIITKLGKDRASWRSVDRTIGGDAAPGVDEFVIVRKPPEAGK